MKKANLEKLTLTELLLLYDSCISDDEQILADEIYKRTGIRLEDDEDDEEDYEDEITNYPSKNRRNEGNNTGKLVNYMAIIIILLLAVLIIKNYSS